MNPTASILANLLSSSSQAASGGQDAAPRSLGGGWSPSAQGDFSHGARPDAAYASLPPLFHPAYSIFPESAPADAISQYNAAYSGGRNAQAAPPAPGGGAPLGGGAAGVFGDSALNQALQGKQ